MLYERVCKYIKLHSKYISSYDKHNVTNGQSRIRRAAYPVSASPMA